MRRRVPLAPAEGWLTLGLVLIMCLTLAWSLDNGRWAGGRGGDLDWLVLAATAGVLIAFVGAKVGWGRWLTYLIGSVFAALIVPILTGLAAGPDGASLHDRYRATAAETMAAFVDLAMLRLGTTTQTLHQVMALGLLTWATSMFAAYAVFGHRQALNAIVAVGALLVGNMTVNGADELGLFVLFCVSSLFLLIRTHASEERSVWLRRRIGDPASISTVNLRGGTSFIAVTASLAFVLTQTAVSRPLAGAWDGIEDRLMGLTQTISELLPGGGFIGSGRTVFGSTSAVSGHWNPVPGVALTITRDPADDVDYYWRAMTYDTAELTRWRTGDTTTRVRPAGSRVLAGLADDPDQPGLHTFAFTVWPEVGDPGVMVSPQSPVEVDEGVRLSHVGEAGFFSRMVRDGGTGSYHIVARVPVRGDGVGHINAPALRATSTDYPPEIVARFAAPPPEGSLGPEARKLKAKILAEAPSSAPVDIAEGLWRELRSSTYEYDPDVRDLPCEGLSTVECFATHKRGYCQYYARTMATILRDLGIPVRIAAGYLPGSREAGIETVRSESAHEWVEVYFMTYGWVLFDPSGAGLPGQVGALPSGRPTASGSPQPSASAQAAPSRPSSSATVDSPGGPVSPIDPGSVGPMIAVTMLLLLAVGGLAFALWLRGPRGSTTPDRAYGMVTWMASRLGSGPRPTQTIYEYAATLGDVLPEVRPELETVARAKVESVYARAALGEERVAGLRAAQRRLRSALFRLAFRRTERRRPR